MRLAASNGGTTFVVLPLLSAAFIIKCKHFSERPSIYILYFMLIYSAALCLCTHQHANSKAVLTAACRHKNSIKIYENCAVSRARVGRPIKPRRHTREMPSDIHTAASFATIRYRWRRHNNTLWNDLAPIATDAAATVVGLWSSVFGVRLFALADLLKRARASWSSVLAGKCQPSFSS